MVDNPRDVPMLELVMRKAELLEKIATGSAKLVDLVYEFDEHPDLLPEAISEHLEHLDELLIAGGYRPEPIVPTPEEVDEWIKERVADAHRDRD